MSAVRLSPMGKCVRCGENEATLMMGDALAITHGGGEPYCERCLVDVQLAHAVERAAVIPELTAKLAELGGPPEKVLCGWAFFPVDGIYQSAICGKVKGHAGDHRRRASAGSVSEKATT